VFDGLIGLVRAEKEGTVQEQVQRCFYYLCKCPDVARERCTEAISKLLAMIKDESKSSEEAACNRREVASVALKESLKGINEVPASKDTAASFAPDLFAVVRDTASAADARVKCCECFTVIVQSSAKYVAANPNLINDLFLLLASSNASSLSLFRKRLVSCIVSLSTQLSDETFNAFLKLLCQKLSETASAAETPFSVASSIVQIIGAVAATPNGSRITNSLEDFITRFVILCKEPTNASMEDSDEVDDSNNEALDELRSLIFQSLEVVLGKCSPAVLIPLLQPVLQLISKFVSYNPNMFGEEEDEDDETEMSDSASGAATAAAAEDGEMGDDDEDAFDDEFGSDFDDDDISDSSWKIRRDSIRCFVAVSAALVQSPVQFVESSKLIFSSLLKRLNDHDESVLLEAISAVSSVVRSCSTVAKAYSSVQTKSIVESLNTLFSSTLAFAAKVSRKLTKILGDEKATVKARTNCVQLAAALVRFDEEACEKGQGGASSDHHRFVQNIVSVWSSVNKALLAAENSSTSTVSSGIPNDPASATLKVESLHFLQAFLKASVVAVSTRQHAVESVPTVAKCVADPYVHSSSEALRVVPHIMASLRKEDGKVGSEDGTVVDNLCVAVVTKYGFLGNSNLETEVKECTINALVSVITIGGNVIPPATFKDKCLPIIMGSIQNESTRTLGIKALNEIASCSLSLDISSIAGSAVDNFLVLVKDVSNKQMRQSALAASAAVFKHETGGKSIPESLAVSMMTEVCSLISSEDFYLSHLAINVAANAISCCNTSSVKKAFADRFVEPINKLISTQPVQGATLSSLIYCFTVCAQTGVFSAPLKVVDTFTSLVAGDVSKQIIASIATICAAYVSNIADASAKNNCIKQLTTLCKKAEGNQSSQCFAMLTIGNIGRDNDLAGMLDTIMKDVAKPAFDKGSDDARSAAAFMLGSVTAGSIPAYIKAIGAWAKEAKDNVQYYVLATLREFASKLVETNNTADCASVCSTVADIVKSLITKDDEGKRNIASECLGKLCALAPATVCPVILSMATDASKEPRTIAAGAIRVMYSNVNGGKSCAAWQCENKPVVVRFIHDNASVLFGLITDAEVQVRHVLLLTLNYILHQNSAELIPDNVFSVVAPAVLRETEVRPELIETVEYGPLKVKQDHGVESRKAAYECLSALLDAYPDALKIEDILAHAGKGMCDEYDVNLLAIQICCKVASSPLTSLAIPPLVDASFTASLEAIMFPSKKKPTPDEEVKFGEAKKKAMRLIVILRNIPGMSTAAPKFTKFVNTRIVPTPILSDMMKEAAEAMDTSK